MTSIDPRQRLAAIVRNEVSAFRDRAAAQATQGARGSGKQEAQQRSRAELDALVAQRVGAIPADDPHRRHKAFRVFLETALLHRLGAGLIQDAAFAQMVDAVQARMQEDPQLAGAAEALATQLLGGNAGVAAPRPAGPGPAG